MASPTLELNAPLTSPPSAPAKREWKNPAVAWLLSLLVPGTGQMYLRKTKRGTWTLVFWAISVAVSAWLLVRGTQGTTASTDASRGLELILGIFLRLAAVLYVFAPLDAYYTAREMNDGTDEVLRFNPRVAAVLNLTTRGFGYYYVEERSKAVLVWFVVGIINQAILTAAQNNTVEGTLSNGLQWAAEFMMLGLAVDAYRIAARANVEALAANPPRRKFLADGLSPALPLCVGIFFALHYFGLAALGTIRPNYSNIDQSAMHLSPMLGDQMYSNPKYGVQVVLPSSWKVDTTHKTFFVQAETDDKRCSAIFMPEAVMPWMNEGAYIKALQRQLAKNGKYQFVNETPSTIGNMPARRAEYIYRVTDDNQARQDFHVMKKGLTMYTVIETAGMGAVQDCEEAFKQVRDSVRVE